MRIISWNVNGLRATYKNGYLLPFVEKEKPDIFCLQEIKASPEQLPEEIRNLSGYFSYFSHSKDKKGYSGVALYTKVKPEKVEYGMGIKKFDDEGRIIVAYYKKDFILLNVYFPNGRRDHSRVPFKLEFYDAFLEFIEKLRKKGHKILFLGDVNTAHEEIDLARPKENQGRTGFLPEERAWLDEVTGRGYVDIFRHFYPEKTGAYTYWDMKTAARDRNVGWRLDYFFASPDLLLAPRSLAVPSETLREGWGEVGPKIKKTKILSDVYGSDHCPIMMEIMI
ncbi:exodeoxyribonuclease III [Candidatus Nomurabacteria bacterium RIFCSPLOWO2_01_FULL_42_20]|uniref:Exodeoxyribonuclease III n=1 Tax=Candidatus Nomurabacteria bacterium RIFCSPHIGHO2_01_FULL_42_16 TaxID=1801743 RepID=A0A1F6VHY2_9BACT|nr:MAG: exodeoxyribonuclease III [Candidatus Nomurabacteria bacterium RIFCSPHIGHO2_01_FULL_42_16]OGI92373.1 MAG: exodeoxyribonuclease III [Candidatus Nomurabacteria bacterium RIFCSPLOWO2_01_FULL_42_20]